MRDHVLLQVVGGTLIRARSCFDEQITISSSGNDDCQGQELAQHADYKA